MLEVSPEMISWILLAAASFSAFMIGKSWAEHRTEMLIETSISSTLDWLIKENMIRWKYDENGEIEILSLDE